jgi:hypothetical protein
MIKFGTHPIIFILQDTKVVAMQLVQTQIAASSVSDVATRIVSLDSDGKGNICLLHAYVRVIWKCGQFVYIIVTAEIDTSIRHIHHVTKSKYS